MKLSDNLTLNEVIKSNTAQRLGIENKPTDEHLDNLLKVAKEVFQPMRNSLGSITVSSGYRSEALNKAIKGSKTSQHCKGQALDLDNDFNSKGPSNKEIFEYIRDVLPFDQLIWEYGDNESPAWVHVSHVSTKENRRQVLKTVRLKSGKTAYREY